MNSARISPGIGMRVRDRRSNSRINTKILCRVEWGRESRDASLLDLSLTGALIAAHSGPPRGSRVTLHLQVSEVGRPVSLTGSVVRGGSYRDDPGSANRYGIRFDGISPDVLRVMSAKLTRKGSA